jgi:hypothetical protein
MGQRPDHVAVTGALGVVSLSTASRAWTTGADFHDKSGIDMAPRRREPSAVARGPGSHQDRDPPPLREERAARSAPGAVRMK